MNATLVLTSVGEPAPFLTGSKKIAIDMYLRKSKFKVCYCSTSQLSNVVKFLQVKSESLN